MVGIRYVCETCDNYNVCEFCKQYNDHEHTLKDFSTINDMPKDMLKDMPNKIVITKEFEPGEMTNNYNCLQCGESIMAKYISARNPEYIFCEKCYKKCKDLYKEYEPFMRHKYKNYKNTPRYLRQPLDIALAKRSISSMEDLTHIKKVIIEDLTWSSDYSSDETMMMGLFG
jgi:hypothetical protein